MLGLLEDLPAAPGPRMVGNELVTVDESNGAVIDDERDDTRCVVAGHRVAIGIEMDERLRVDLDRLDARGTQGKVEAVTQGKKLPPAQMADVNRYNELLNQYLGARCHVPPA